MLSSWDPTSRLVMEPVMTSRPLTYLPIGEELVFVYFRNTPTSAIPAAPIEFVHSINGSGHTR